VRQTHRRGPRAQIRAQPGMMLGEFLANLEAYGMGLVHTPAPYDITMGGVLAISGILIAYDTQSLKMGYFENEGDTRSLAVMTNFGALTFFISFYNIFTILMSMLSSND
jgi:hypothetical protein